MTGVALVTGASRGLGYAVAKAFGAAGWQVVALARTVGGLEELDDAIRAAGGEAATLVPMDLADDAALERLGPAILERWGRLDLLVHCAVHAVALSPAGHVEPRDFDRAMAVNARASLRLIGTLDPLLRASPGGHAVFLDDPMGGKFAAAYAASKAAQRAIVTAYAEEARVIGPRVTLFTPPPMPTALRARFFPGEGREGLTPPGTVAERLMQRITAPA
ncbi:MAG TPA: SDR family oxidoreductase [Paracoccaceae bacterium]|nr:SDR family oxidoreductase [Paracoccaceae bacterium]